MDAGFYRTVSCFINIRSFLVAIIFSTVAQFGDLTISYFKRLEKIKDTGKILPGHGGIFDRIDGLMFVVILASLLYYFTTGAFSLLLLVLTTRKNHYTCARPLKPTPSSPVSNPH